VRISGLRSFFQQGNLGKGQMTRPTARTRSWATWGLIAYLGIAFLPGVVSAQGAPPTPDSPPSQEMLPAPKPANLAPRIEPIVTDESGETPGPAGVPINLPAALQLAFSSNLDIVQAREGVNQARARLSKANLVLIPNFNLGSAYNHHEGNIQKTEGNIIKANRDSLYVGGGPSLAFQTTEAIFGWLAARQLAVSSQAGLQRVNNDTLFAAADAYLNVLRARRRVARINETLEHLVAQQPAAMRGQAKGLLPLIQAFVEGGAREAFPPDLERVRVEVLRRQEELAGAVDNLRSATAELARLLRLDPVMPLDPIEDFRQPLPLTGEDWSLRPVEDLVELALTRRPELAEYRALADAARDRVRAARYRPLLPNVALNYAWGDFGGDPELLKVGFGPSGHLAHFAPRTDFDASIFWRLDNLGLGNRAELRETQALHRGAVQRYLQIQDRIITQVVQARSEVQANRQRLTITRQALFDDKGAPAGPVFRSIRLNFERIRGGEGRPLEVLDSIRGLSDSLEAYGQAVTDYERSRFRLAIALGLSPLTLVEAPAIPAASDGSPPGAPPSP
jgi:outer membrane protein TolC